MLLRGLFLCALMTTTAVAAAAPTINIFEPGSYRQILQQRQQQPFMLVLWSIDCPPCYQELALLADKIKLQPRLELVLVATDTSGDIDEIKKLLRKFGLSNVNAWVFNNEMAQQLRYEIDPDWYGELPRSYLFDSQHQRQAVTGVLKPETLQRWQSPASE